MEKKPRLCYTAAMTEKEALFKKKALPVKLLLASIIIFILVFSLAATATVLTRAKLQHPVAYDLTPDRADTLSAFLAANYPETILKPLPYTISATSLPVQAGTAIIADVSNGCILWEKNADLVIPPASMIKLVVMYVVEAAIARGDISYDDLVELPSESWAVNMPPDSSLMFLAEGQKVTVDELLQGLAVVSGNDAAYALASHVAGDMETFVALMNTVLQDLGLTQTTVVEPSGYSELNTTTAREFLAFCRKYIYDIPESLEKYHSQRSFSYPKAENLPEGMQPGDPTGSNFILSTPLTRPNTNKALDMIPGADGLKTGYIDESGYNLALTAARNGTRFLSVTMNGPGAGSWEGNQIRAKDGNVLMDWAFANFTSVPVEAVLPVDITVTGAKGISAIRVIPAQNVTSVTVPHIQGITESTLPEDIPLTVQVQYPDHLQAPVTAGDTVGTVEYRVNGALIQSVPLLADRSVEKSFALKGWFEERLLSR